MYNKLSEILRRRGKILLAVALIIVTVPVYSQQQAAKSADDATIESFITATHRLTVEDLKTLRPDTVVRIERFDRSGVAYISAKTMAKTLDAIVVYFPATDIIALKNSTTSVYVPSNSNYISVNGRTARMNSRFMYCGDTLYVPVHEMARLFNSAVKLKGETVEVSRPFYSKVLLVGTNNPDIDTYGASMSVVSTKYYSMFYYETVELAQQAQKKLLERKDVKYAEFDGFIANAFPDEPEIESPKQGKGISLPDYSMFQAPVTTATTCCCDNTSLSRIVEDKTMGSVLHNYDKIVYSTVKFEVTPAEITLCCDNIPPVSNEEKNYSSRATVPLPSLPDFSSRFGVPDQVMRDCDFDFNFPPPPPMPDSKVPEEGPWGWYIATPKNAVNLQPYADAYNSMPGTKKNVIVAVLDSGFNSSDPIFNGRMVQGYNVADNNTNLVSTYPHGTSVAGMVAQFAPFNNVKIMPVKISSGDSTGCAASDSIKGIYYAVDNNANVINMSYGSVRSITDAEQAALDYGYNNGIVTVASAGNEGVDANSHTPSCAEHVMSIGAIDTTRTVNGANPIMWTSGVKSNYGDGVDIWAPGQLNYRPGNDDENGQPTWRWGSGTSNSAPIVAGYIASLMSLPSVASAITPDSIPGILKSSAKVIDTSTQAGYEDPPLPNVGNVYMLDMCAALYTAIYVSSVINADLSDLSVNGYVLSPSFNANTSNYTVTVPYSVSSVTISASVASSNATVSGAGLKLLEVGDNTFDIVVKAEACYTKTYSITITREAEESTGIAPVTANQLKVFPNPAQNDIFIQTESRIEKVEIYSLAGALVLFENNFIEKISVSALPRGVYLIRVYTDNGVVSGRIVK